MKTSNFKAKRKIAGIMTALAASTFVALGSVAVTPAETYAAVATTKASALVSRQAAKNTALKHAGAKASAIKGYEIEPEYKKGVPYYDIEFKYNNYEYDYLINAKTGKITKWEKKAIKKTVKATKPAQTAGKVKITADKAKTTALTHAKLSASKIYAYKCKLDKEGGIYVYEIEFKSGRFEYEYEINANTGKITDFEKERI